MLAACRRFPDILDGIASGALNLTAVRRLGPHLTAENGQAVLARAVSRKRAEIELLIAELAPRPDVEPSVRKLPVRTAHTAPSPPAQAALGIPAQPATDTAPPAPTAAPAPERRPIVQPSAPERYRVQFTIGPGTHEKLRRVQTLLRREIPNGDPALIFDRALDLLLAKTERAKLGKGVKRRAGLSIRFETDKAPQAPPAGRHIPNAVKSAVARRDGGRCAFVAPGGRRCTEEAYLEFHHVQPYARGGPATVGNIALHCRRHNTHEARLVFGDRGGASPIREGRATFG